MTVDRNGYCDNPECVSCKSARRPERTQGVGSGYVRGEFIPARCGHFYDREFWTHVTVSHGREVR